MPLLDITAFASAWTALYTHFHAIGYLPPNSVSYPPHTPALPIPVPPPGSNSLQTLLPPLRPDLHPLVLSLLPLLPYPASYDHASTFEILPRTRAQPYTDEGQLLRARDPEMDYLDEEPRLDGDESVVLRREEVALTKQLPQGWTIVVDVAEGELVSFPVLAFFVSTMFPVLCYVCSCIFGAESRKEVGDVGRGLGDGAVKVDVWWCLLEADDM